MEQDLTSSLSFIKIVLIVLIIVLVCVLGYYFYDKTQKNPLIMQSIKCRLTGGEWVSSCANREKKEPPEPGTIRHNDPIPCRFKCIEK